MNKRALILAGAALAALSAPASGGVLVVRSAGPSAKAYPPGKTLPDNGSVALKAGDLLTVLVSSTRRTLRGPGNFTLAAPKSLAASTFNPRSRFGAMRAGEIPASPSLWHVDVSQSGTFCVAGGERPQLWRPDAAEAATLSIVAPGGAGHEVPWAAGEDSLAWPPGLALGDGEYRLAVGEGGEVSKLRFADIGALPEDPEAMAGAFIDKGCQTQLDLFIENMPAEES